MKTKKVIEKELRQNFESYLPEMIDRYQSITSLMVIPNHYFTETLKECLSLYIHGFFISSIMVSQGVNDAFGKFLIEKNNHHPADKEKRDDSILILVQKKILPKEWYNAFMRIYKSYRNDYHHVNEIIDTLSHKSIAEKNLKDLFFLETEIFKHSYNDGVIVPNYPQYWNINSDGMTNVCVKFN